MRSSLPLVVAACALALFFTSCGGKDRELLREIDGLMETRSYDQALSLLQRSLREDPQNKRLLRKQVLLFLKTEQVSYAIAAHRKLQEASPDDPFLYNSFKDKDPVVRVTAAKAMGLMKDPRSIDVLLKGADDPERNVRQAVVLALGDIKDPRAIPVLTSALGDSYWFVRAEAAQALGKVGDASSATKLFELLADSDNYVRQNARKALQELATEENKPAYIRELSSTDPNTAIMAAVALAQAGHAEGLDLLNRTLTAGQYPDIPDIIRAQVRLRDPSSLPSIRGVLDHENHQLRALAILALGEFRDQESVPRLRAIATNTSEPGNVKTASLVALNKITSGR